MQIKPVTLSKEGGALITDNGYCAYQNYLFEIML